MRNFTGLFLALAIFSAVAAKTHTQINILKAAPYNTSCESDSDCTPAPGCCPAPCSSLVINKRDLDKAKAALHCPKEAKCPNAGSCQTHEYLCVRKTCKLVYSKDKDFRPRR